MAIVMAFSSPKFGGEQTGRVIEPLLAWLFPWLSPAHAAFVHLLIRKLGHLTEYGVLAWLWFRAFPRRADRWRAWVALGITAGWAFLDELHQATTLTRTPSAADIALDVAGAVAALTLACGGWRRVERWTTALLWVAAVGGASAIVADWIAGVPSWPLAVTIGVATAVLALRRWRSAPRES
jgi:VanZ family protein